MSDFTNITESAGQFTTFELDEGVDFLDLGDGGVAIIRGAAYGEGTYGEGPYGGDDTVIILNGAPTVWTNIDTP